MVYNTGLWSYRLSFHPGELMPSSDIALTTVIALSIPTQLVFAQSQEFEMIQIPVGEFVFDAAVAGPEDGDLVIMLHGFPQSWFEYRHQIPILAEMGFRVVAPNQRGYSPGARPHGVDAYVMPNLVGDVLGMADWLGRERFHLVGHDWGAAVAWYTALASPARVQSVVAISVPHPFAFGEALSSPSGQQASMSGYMATFRAADAEERFLANDAALLRSIYDGSGNSADETQVYLDLLGSREAIGAILNWYRAMIVQSAMSSLTPIRMPTTYVWSSGDVALGREGAELTEKYIEGPYRFVVIDDIGHWIPEQAPDQLNEALQVHFKQAARQENRR